MNRLVIAAITLVSVILTGCAEPEGPEQAVRSRIAVMESALAQRSPTDFLDALSASFLGGKSGRLDIDKPEAKKMLAVYFLRYSRIRVAITQIEVVVDPYEQNLASATARVVLAGGERLIPNSAGVYQISSQWQNFDGDWKLTRLEWQ